MGGDQVASDGGVEVRRDQCGRRGGVVVQDHRDADRCSAQDHAGHDADLEAADLGEQLDRTSRIRLVYLQRRGNDLRVLLLELVSSSSSERGDDSSGYRMTAAAELPDCGDVQAGIRKREEQRDAALQTVLGDGGLHCRPERDVGGPVAEARLEHSLFLEMLFSSADAAVDDHQAGIGCTGRGVDRSFAGGKVAHRDHGRRILFEVDPGIRDPVIRGADNHHLLSHHGARRMPGCCESLAEGLQGAETLARAFAILEALARSDCLRFARRTDRLENVFQDFARRRHRLLRML